MNMSNLKLRNVQYLLVYCLTPVSLCLEFGVDGVSLNIYANARAVVGRSDEFDAGGFEGCFDCIDSFH